MSHVHQSLLINHHQFTVSPVIAGNDELNILLIDSNVLNARNETWECNLLANIVMHLSPVEGPVEPCGCSG
ncbi:hypothetical protein PM082_016595 [Marasmius tenuissimus]|nr:hypothetical protein PM082_016595 [Marasmius tenuissimus]